MSMSLMPEVKSGKRDMGDLDMAKKRKTKFGKFDIPRKFDGKIYKWKAGRRKKSDAQKLAMKYRRAGYPSRVIKRKKMWGIYVRTKPGWLRLEGSRLR